jgi:hypothetical protein
VKELLLQARRDLTEAANTSHQIVGERKEQNIHTAKTTAADLLKNPYIA